MEKIQSFKYIEPETDLWGSLLSFVACIQRYWIEVSPNLKTYYMLHEITNNGL